jgi:hypothetical protein
MIDTTVAQPDTTATTDTAETTDTGTTNTDPFVVDESQFVSLTPEQRAALDPVLSKWKETAKTYAQKEREAEGKKYSDHVKKAQALEKLVSDPRFVKWYQETNNPSTTATPQSVASAEEWAQAYQSLSAGDPMPLEKLQTKLVMSVGGPALQKTQVEMNMLRQENEMTKLFANHADAKDLDQIGREDNPDAPSLLQLAAQSVMDKQGGTWEQAYVLAKQVALAMENKGKRAAMGLVAEKKGSVTEKPSTNSKEEGVQYVDTMEEAMNANIEAALDGRKVQYRVKK